MPAMLRFFMMLGMSLFFISASTLSADAPPMAQHPFFKHLVGKWTAEGSLTNQEGNVIPYSAEWNGAVVDDSTFTMEGSRTIDKTTQSYSWTFTQDSSTGLLEVIHTVQDATGTPQRFEASFTEATLTLEVSTYLNSNNAKVTLKETFEGPAHDKLLTDVQFVDDNGITTLSGVITNTKSPDI